jgi:hypothetical protein
MNSGWRKDKKQKYFPSKVPKRMGNIAEFNQVIYTIIVCKHLANLLPNRRKYNAIKT